MVTAVESYAAAWRERLRAERARNAELAEVARVAARKCADVLRERFGAGRVYLFGSLVDGRFHPRSDIDLAVEDLAPELHWKALRALAAEAPPGIDVDLVPLEDATPRLRQRIAESGLLL